MPKGAPSHLRKRLGVALAQERRTKDISQTAAAKLIGGSQAKIANLERAEVDKIKLRDLDTLMAAYGIPEDQQETMRKWARAPYSGTGVWVETSPGAAWWQDHKEIESQARVINAHHLQAIDGLVQCPSYSHRQITLGSGVNVEARVSERQQRQDDLFNLPSPPQCAFIFDESCLYKTMGDPEMMAAQCEYLLELTKRPSITILIQRSDAEISTSTYGFTLLKFGSAVMQDFVSIEYAVSAATIDDEDAVRFFQTRWENIRAASLNQQQSVKLMRHVMDVHRRKKE